jgi:hypothetical protein
MADIRGNLSEEMRNQIMQQGLMPQGWYVEGLRGGTPMDDGRYYTAQFDQSAYGQGEEAGMVMNPGAVKANHFLGYDKSWADGGKHQGEFGQVYDAEGKYAKDYAWKDDEAKKNLMMFLAAAGGMAMLPGGALSGAAGGSGAAMGPITEAQAAAEMAALQNQLAPYLAGAGGAAGGAAGAASAGGGGGGGAGAAGGLGAGAGGGGGSGGGLSSLLGGGNNLLGIGSTVLGGLLGSRGQQQEQTATRQWDSRLDPFLFGDQGLFTRTQQTMQRSQSPARLAEADRLRQFGLLNATRPAARNPFGG